MGGDGDLSNVKDAASKAAENAARLAGLFHLYEHGQGGRISAAHFTAAARIVTWHLSEARRFLGGMALPKPVSNAIKLDEWLVAVCRARRVEVITAREAMNRGPNAVRIKTDLHAALAELTEANRAKLGSDGRTIRVNPALVTQL